MMSLSTRRSISVTKSLGAFSAILTESTRSRTRIIVSPPFLAAVIAILIMGSCINLDHHFIFMGCCRVLQICVPLSSRFREERDGERRAQLITHVLSSFNPTQLLH